jgi:hypothetical protein
MHCLQWHRYQDQDPGHIWLRDRLREAARNPCTAIPEDKFNKPNHSVPGELLEDL